MKGMETLVAVIPDIQMTHAEFHETVVNQSLLDMNVNPAELLKVDASLVAEAFNMVNEFPVMVHTPIVADSNQYRKTLIKMVAKLNEENKNTVYTYNKLVDEFCEISKSSVILNNYTQDLYSKYIETRTEVREKSAENQDLRKRLDNAIAENEIVDNILTEYHNRWSVRFGNWVRSFFKK